jgi:hypothetical protein
MYDWVSGTHQNVLFPFSNIPIDIAGVKIHTEYDDADMGEKMTEFEINQNEYYKFSDDNANKFLNAINFDVKLNFADFEDVQSKIKILGLSALTPPKNTETEDKLYINKKINVNSNKPHD